MPIPDRREAGGWAGPLRAFLVSTVLVVATLAFSFSINIGSFRQSYAETLMAAYSAVGDKAVGNIQEALGYGKPLDDFHGMETILKQITVHLPWVETVQVALADGRIVHTDNGRTDQRMKESARRRATTELAKRPFSIAYNSEAGTYALHVPIRNPDDGALAGFLIILSNGGDIDRNVADFQAHIAPFLVWTGGATIALLALFAVAASLAPRRSSKMERAHRFLTLATLVAVQIASGAVSYSVLSAANMKAAEQATDIVAHMIRGDIEAVIHRGVEYRSLHGLDAYFDKLKANVPFLQSIELHIDDEDESSKQPGFASTTPWNMMLRWHWKLLSDRSGGERGLLMMVDGNAMNGRLTEFALDMATILITSLLFMFELHRALGRRQSVAPEEAPSTGVSNVRFMTFLLYFAAFLPVSFVPPMMATFDRELFGLTPSQAAAAPLTAEMLCGVAALLLAGRLAGAVGWRSLCLTGFAAGAAGFALSAVAADPLVFVLSRGLAGAGTMCALMGINICIGLLRGRTDSATLQAGMFAGMYTGVNCGAVSGALMAASHGPVSVFVASGAVLLLGLPYILFGLPRLALAAAPAVEPGTEAERTASTTRRAWRGIAFLLLISMPTAVAGMFLPFYLPLFIADLGLSSATVGRAYLMHGLCVVLLGPALSRFVARRLPILWGTLLSGGAIAAALLLFGLHAMLWTAFLSVFLIGVAESFGLGAQLRHAEALVKEAPHRRESMLALHVNARKLGQAVGPVLIGTAAATGPAGLGLVGVGLIATLMLYAVLPHRRHEPARVVP